MENVKRPFLLTGLIINNVIFGIFFMYLILASDFLFSEYFNIENLFTILVLALTVIGIIFSSMGLAVIFKPYEVIKRKKGYILTSFIFTCIIILFGFIGLISGGFISIILIFLFMVTITGAVFTIIGYVKEIGNYQSATFNSQTIDPFEDAYSKIERLTRLKEQNVISDEEYEILKQKQVNILKKQ